MKLQTKLIAAFGFLAAVAMALAAIAFWKADKMGNALYEVGAVRLPSIQGLGMMSGAITELGDSVRDLLADDDPVRFSLELERQRDAWRRFDEGWALYEPLPQSPEEKVKWRELVPLARAWREELGEILPSIASALAGGERTQLAAARQRLMAALDRDHARVVVLLKEITDLNYHIAEEAKRNTVAGREDLARMRVFFAACGIASTIGAIVFSVLASRRLSRPVTQLAAALGRVARGDRSVRVSADSRDEIGSIADALNQMVDALREGEERLRLAGDNLPDSMLYQVRQEKDGSMRFVHVSAGVGRLHGVSAAAVLEDSSVLFKQIAEEDLPALAEATSASIASMGEFHFVTRIRRPDGSVRWVEMRSVPRRDREGCVIWDGIETDITGRKQSESELARAHRALRALSACNRVLIHAKDEGSLLRDICRVVVEEGGYRIAWVGFAENDERKTVRAVADAGGVSEYVAQLDITWADDTRGRGPTGTAIRTRQPATCHNFESDPGVAPWRDLARRYGVRSSVAIPLAGDGAVLGSVSIYSSDPDAFDRQELELLTELAGDLAYGIESLRARHHRDLAEAKVRSLLAEAEAARAALQENFAALSELQSELRASEERYRGAMRESAIGMALIGLDFRWLEVNPALCRIVGYEREELVGIDTQFLTHPDARAEGRQRRELVAAGKIGPQHFEKRYIHKSGEVVWAHVSLSLVRNGSGEPLHLVSQIQDITARKQAEQSLTEAAERLALALRASRAGIWRYELRTGRHEWDERMFAIFELPSDAGSPATERILEQVVADDRAQVQPVWAPGAGEVQTGETRFRVHGGDGTERHVELQWIVHRDNRGIPDHLIGVASDISDIVNATSAAERLRAQLQQSQKMEALGTLAAGVAHDFNNLLTGINGFVDLASNTLGPDHEATGLLTQARRGATSARDLVRRILNFSRDNKDQPRKIVDLAAVVRDTAPLIAAALPANISLSLETAPEPALVLADTGQLQQVLMNLCTNSLHAIGAKPGRIRIEVGSIELGEGGHREPPPGCAAGRHVRLAIGDNGCGMDEATRKKIFEPFFTTKAAGVGTGLGLSIVRDIVASHEGGIELTTAPGRGTTFAILIPAAHVGPASPTIAAHATVHGNGRRVMVLDDEESVGVVVRMALQRRGFEAVVHAVAVDAWKLFECEPRGFDLLIIDQNMPGLDGTEFVARVRSIAPSLPVIMMSGRFENAEVLAQLHASVLRKPFEIGDLLAAVEASILRQSAAAARPGNG